MQVEWNIQSGGAFENRREKKIVQETAARHAVDQRTLETKLPDRPLEFLRRRLGIVHLQRRKSGKARWISRHRFRDLVIHEAAKRNGPRSFQDLRRRMSVGKHLHVDPASVHVRDSPFAQFR